MPSHMQIFIRAIKRLVHEPFINPRLELSHPLAEPEGITSLTCIWDPNTRFTRYSIIQDWIA
jgi:hypothetical protein